MRKNVLWITGAGLLLLVAGVYYLYNGQPFSATSIKAGFWLEPECRAVARDIGSHWMFDAQILVENDEPLWDSGTFDSDEPLETIDQGISQVLARYGYVAKSPERDQLKRWSLGDQKEIALNRGPCDHCYVLVCVKGPG